MTLPDISPAVFTLIKAQVWRETQSKLQNIQQLTHDLDYSLHLRRLERDKVMALSTPDELDTYLRESRRLSLQEWLDSLSWEDTQEV